MRRAFTSLFCAAAFTLCAPLSNAQYYYPPAPTYYGLMPVQYMPPYGVPGAYAPMQRPVYYPPQQMMRQPMPMPMQYPPMQYPPNYQPRPNTYGPLAESQDIPVYPAPGQGKPNNAARLPAVPASSSRPGKFYATNNKTGEPPQQQTQPGPACADGACGPEGCGPAGCIDPIFKRHHPYARGHCIGDFAALVLFPMSTRQAFTSSTTGTTTTIANNFGSDANYAGRANLAFILHNGWGARASATYLVGDASQSLTNTDAATTIKTPLGFALSPSASLTAATGTDVMQFRQVLTAFTGQAEIVKEAQWRKSTFLMGAGARYSDILQSYKATSTVDGSTANGNVSSVTQYTYSRFAGIGPTISLELVQPVTSGGLALYANLRGSVIFGVDRFQNSNSADTVVVVGADVTTVTTSNQSVAYDSRTATIADVELGVQYGKRVGSSYLFTRIGAVYQGWYNVGTPTSATGDLSLLGATAVLGITY